MDTERRTLKNYRSETVKKSKTKQVYVMERAFCQDKVLYNFCKSQCSKHPNVVARVAWFDCHEFQKENDFFERTEPQVFNDFFDILKSQFH